jgi:hypothetical protein
MTATRLSRVVGVFAIAVLAGRTAAAQAPTPANTAENAAIKLGPVGLNPSLALRDIGVDNNVFHDNQNPKSDFTFTFTPRAEVLFSPRRLHLSLATAVDFVYFDTYDSERGTNQSSEIKANVDLGRLQPYASYGGANTRERYNSEIDERARHHDHTSTGGVSLKIASRTTIAGGVRHTSTSFEEGSAFRGEDLAVALDNDIDAVDGSVGMQFTPVTGVNLVVSQEWQRFDFSPERDSDSLRITPTVTFSPGGLLNGSASIGYRRFNGRAADLPDFSGLVAAVNIGATIVGRHRLETRFERDLRYSYEDAAPYYLSTGGSLTLTTQVSGPFDVRVTGTLQSLDYGQSNPGQSSDTYKAYGGGVGYRIRPTLRVGVNLEWSRRDSDVVDRAFNNHRIYGTFTWGTTP